MAINQTNKIKRIVSKICEGNFCFSDIGLLFILLRPYFREKNNLILLDLADFIAHSDERNKGETFKHIHSYVNNFIEVSKKGGIIHGFSPVFNREEIINFLIEILETFDLNFDANKLREQKDAIIDCFLELIEEAEFDINQIDSRLKRCFLRRDGQKIFIIFNLSLDGHFIKSSSAATIQASLFSEKLMENSLVSVIVPTKNSSKTIEACLESIKNQTYQNIEIIVVDNNSTDDTKEIAKKFTEKVFNKGPERSTQRNFGVNNSQGEFVLIIDSDMVLSEKVIESCINVIKKDNQIIGLIVPEESFGEGFWAQCKKLERSFYVGVDWIEAARFFRKDVYQKVGGFNEKMISAEDWDLSQRIEVEGKISRTNDYIYHNEGNLSLLNTLKKKLYYAKQLRFYTENKNNYQKIKKQTGILERYKLFFSQPKKLFQNPILGIGMLFMKTCEFAFGGVGYLISKIKK